MKDPFPPARQAGVLAAAASHQYFTLQESASRLLPALCSMTMDPEKTVRDQASTLSHTTVFKLNVKYSIVCSKLAVYVLCDQLYIYRFVLFSLIQAFKAIKCFLGKLEKVSETPELAAEMGKHGCTFDIVLESLIGTFKK